MAGYISKYFFLFSIQDNGKQSITHSSHHLVNGTLQNIQLYYISETNSPQSMYHKTIESIKHLKFRKYSTLGYLKTFKGAMIKKILIITDLDNNITPEHFSTMLFISVHRPIHNIDKTHLNKIVFL